MTDATSPNGVARADHICIGVDDFEGVLAWYRDKFGFRIERRWTVAALPGMRLGYLIGLGGFRLEVIGGGRGPRGPAGADFGAHLGVRGWNHLCFWTEDVDATMADLAARGVPAFTAAADYPEGAGRRVAFVQDSEGNVIEFAGPLAGDRAEVEETA